ncbi:MAG TPA: ABC transporter ATP-binding protein [Acidimicrobiales bacterium]|nr:ABC transporter ATP-binding protein [Acidimicrobiales bacterium]
MELTLSKLEGGRLARGLEGTRTRSWEGTAPESEGSDLPLLAFEGVSLVYPDGTEALCGVDLQVRKGELVSIVGPSGCGKSTLLRIASGLLEASSGRVQAEREQLGYVFQDPTLLPWRTVLTNVALLCELRGVSKQERLQRATSAIGLVGLSGFENHHPQRLSGGMRMRASLARALTIEPTLFLFDEPFGALDEITRLRLNEELLAMFELRRFGGVFVTHSVSEAVFLSSRVVVMSGRPGRVVDEVTIPFGYPRQPELRFDPEFARVAGEVSASLRDGALAA